MPCSDYNTYWEFLYNFQFYDAVYCLFTGEVGLYLAPLIIFGSLGVAFYMYADSLIMPLVLSMILGGVIVVQLPPGPVRLIGVTVLFGVGFGGYLIVRRLEV